MKNHFLTAIIFAILFSCFNTFSFAQNSSSDSTSQNTNSTHIFDVTFVNEFSLGYNIYSNSKSEIRLLLQLNSNGKFSDGEGTNISTSNNSVTKTETSEENNHEYNGIYFTTQYLYKFIETDLGELYAGIGPMVGYYWDNYENNNSNVNDDGEYSYKYNSSTNNFSVGLTSLMGIRGKLHKAISVFAEFQINTNWQWGETTRENKSDFISSNSDKSEYKTDNNIWTYEIRYAKIGIRFSI